MSGEDLKRIKVMITIISHFEFIGEKVVVRSFVISCRAAQKQIEDAFFATNGK
jgi:predicted enzyme involved in methoxymalonyl-ACP biosynthesis